MTPSKRILSQRQAEERLAYWQQVLRLLDWDITVAVVRYFNFEGEVWGDVVMKQGKRAAHIRLLDPADANDPEAQDMDVTLVHELLHLHMWEFAPWGLAGKDSRAEERTIDSLAKSFVALERRNQNSEEVQMDWSVGAAAAGGMHNLGEE